MQSEFDKYIDHYRSNLDRSLALSGETSKFFASYKAKKLAEWLPDRVFKKQYILDFGCGDGMMTHVVANEFAQSKLFGVDPSPKSIEVAQKTYQHISFLVNSEFLQR